MAMPWVHHPIAGWFLLLGGVAMVGGAGWIGFDNYRFVAASVSAPGKVVALERRSGPRGSTRDVPVVEYADPVSGERVRFESAFGMRPSPFAVGDAVTVAVRRDSPRVEIDSFWSLWALPCLLALFGAACVVAGRSVLKATRSP